MSIFLFTASYRCCCFSVFFSEITIKTHVFYPYLPFLLQLASRTWRDRVSHVKTRLVMPFGSKKHYKILLRFALLARTMNVTSAPDIYESMDLKIKNQKWSKKTVMKIGGLMASNRPYARGRRASEYSWYFLKSRKTTFYPNLQKYSRGSFSINIYHIINSRSTKHCPMISRTQ